MAENNIHLDLQGSHITFQKGDILFEDSIALLCDIPETVTIQPKATMDIATPIVVKGDSKTIMMIEIHAGQGDPVNGASGFVYIPDRDNQDPLVVRVYNNTSSILQIPPRTQIGIASFVQVLEGRENEDTGEQTEPASAPFVLNVPAQFNPKFISEDDAPSLGTSGAAAVDLKADIETELVLEPGMRKIVPTGLYTAIPDGYEGQIRPRSGLAAKNGITIVNSPGTIDSDYRGEIMIILLNTSDMPYTIKPSERIAQMLFAPALKAKFEYVDDLGDTDRGTGGFGSTGK